MPAKRPNGTGSVYQRGDGYWVVSVSVGSKRVVKYRKTQKEAQTLLSELMVSQARHTLSVPSHLTLCQWVEQWLELNAQRLRPSTLRTYRQAITHVTNVIGNHRLDKLTPLLLTRTFSDLNRSGVGKRRLHLAHTYLKTCLTHAVDLNIISVNPMERVRKPHWEKQQREYWTVEEASRFVDYCLVSQRRWAPLFGFLTTTGLRISEALALTWQDVDWTNNQIRIRQALVWAGNECEIQIPKTKAGKRTVSLTESARLSLQKIPRGTDSNGYIFRTATGAAPHPSQLRRYLLPLCERAEVNEINIHGLRHVAAMLALEATGDAYLVQQRLGHSNVNITLGIYGYPAKKEQAVAVGVDRLLNATSGT